MKNTNEDRKQMSSINVVVAHESAYNGWKMKGSIDQCKEKMAQMKETLRKEQGEGREVKRNHEAMLSYLERLHEAFQVLEAENDDLVLSNNIIDGENKDLERKILGLGSQRAATNKQPEELKAWVTELEAQNSSLEIQLKTTNERKIDVTPLREHALLLRRKIYQVQLKLAKEVYKIK